MLVVIISVHRRDDRSKPSLDIAVFTIWEYFDAYLREGIGNGESFIPSIVFDLLGLGNFSMQSVCICDGLIVKSKRILRCSE